MNSKKFWRVIYEYSDGTTAFALVPSIPKAVQAA